MSISITDFKTWAGQNQRTAVAVNNGALDAASNQIGIFDRIFRRGTANRAKEAVIAAFMAKYSVQENHQPLPAPGPDGVVTVDLNITSVALLTPDKTRHRFVPGSLKDERRMLMDQTDAWDAVSRNGVTFQFNGRQIRVRPNVVTFNVGVNEGAVKLSGIAPNRAGGWDVSDEMNKRAFETFTNEVITFVNDKTADANARVAALTLFNQCRNVFVLKGERIDSHDAYIAGFKTGNVDSITERLGGKKYRNLHRGGSDHVFG
jgi:hypothetical protein